MSSGTGQHPRRQIHVHARCVGSRRCVEVAPAHFTLDAEEKTARIVKQPAAPSEVERCERAVSACPTHALVWDQRDERSDKNVGYQETAPNGLSVDAVAIDHVNLYVTDLERSTAFYSRLLGLAVKEEGANKGIRWRILGCAGRFYVALYENPSAKFYPDDLHINHVGLHVRDFDASVGRIRALGIRLEYGDQPVHWPRSRSAYVKDPDGITIEFTERFGGGLD